MAHARMCVIPFAGEHAHLLDAEGTGFSVAIVVMRKHKRYSSQLQNYMAVVVS